MYLRKLALFINKGDDVHRFVGYHVQRVLIVRELDVLPADVLQVVLLLLQFEDVANKKLLQVLVGKVDAQLLKTTAETGCLTDGPQQMSLYLFFFKVNMIFTC